MESIKRFAADLRDRMAEQGLTQAAVAQRAGWTRERVRQLLNGPNMTIATARRLAHAVDQELELRLSPHHNVED